MCISFEEVFHNSMSRSSMSSSGLTHTVQRVRRSGHCASRQTLSFWKLA